MAFGLTSYIGGAWNIGTDSSITIRRDDNGAAVALGGMRDNFKVTEKDTVESDDTIDNGGRVTHTIIPGGYQGTIMVDRHNDDFTSFIKGIQASKYAGGSEVFCTLVHTINNRQYGTTTTDTYTKVVFLVPDWGTWTRTKRTQLSIEFHATECL